MPITIAGVFEHGFRSATRDPAVIRTALTIYKGADIGLALPELLAESDFIVLAAPLTPETHEMINARTLAMVKPGAWLINVARGRLIDERALLRALRDGPLGGAVLDTFHDEPLPADSPFYDEPNVIVTPHTSWSSGRVLDRSVELFCDNLRRFATGEPLLNVVDPSAGY